MHGAVPSSPSPPAGSAGRQGVPSHSFLFFQSFFLPVLFLLPAFPAENPGAFPYPGILTETWGPTVGNKVSSENDLEGMGATGTQVAAKHKRTNTCLQLGHELPGHSPF